MDVARTGRSSAATFAQVTQRVRARASERIENMFAYVSETEFLRLPAGVLGTSNVL